MTTTKPVTLKQVAKKAGVSTQIASCVLNNRPNVAPETRQVVKKIIKQLGYQPNAVARSLIWWRSQTLIVEIAKPGQYGPTRRLLGAASKINRCQVWLHEKPSQIPVPLTYNSKHLHNNLPEISADNRAGRRLATRHLRGQGLHNKSRLSQNRSNKMMPQEN